MLLGWMLFHRQLKRSMRATDEGHFQPRVFNLTRLAIGKGATRDEDEVTPTSIYGLPCGRCQAKPLDVPAVSSIYTVSMPSHPPGMD